MVTKDVPISPRFTPYDFLSRCKFSTLTTRQPMVEFYLLTFPRFPLRKKKHKSYFGKNRTHDFRTSRCADNLLDHSGDELSGVLRLPPWFAAEGYTYSSTAVVLQYCTVVLYSCLQQQQTGAGYHTRFEKWGACYLWSAVPLPFGPLQYAPFLFVAAVYTSMARSYSYCHLGTEHLFLWSISYFSKNLRLNFLTASFLIGGRICTHL